MRTVYCLALFFAANGWLALGIVAASAASPQHLVIGVLCNVSDMNQSIANSERAMAVPFFKRVLAKDDLAFVISFGETSTLEQPLTSNVERLERAMSRIPPGSGQAAYDAVYVAATEVLTPQTGRNVLVVVSQGRDTNSIEKESNVVAALQKASVTCFVVLDESQSTVGEVEMRRLAEATGGKLFTCEDA